MAETDAIVDQQYCPIGHLGDEKMVSKIRKIGEHTWPAASIESRSPIVGIYACSLLPSNFQVLETSCPNCRAHLESDEDDGSIHEKNRKTQALRALPSRTRGQETGVKA